ncbi:MAG: hypothetical protein ACR2QC_07870 [Gammaproteobacteria bacterium]
MSSPTAEELSVEQMVRNILEAQGIEQAQSLASGDIVEASNLLSEYLAGVGVEARKEERRAIAKEARRWGFNYFARHIRARGNEGEG